MFDHYTLEQQREDEAKRGWKPNYSALTYCTAEAVIFRVPKNRKTPLDLEIVDAIRTSGAPDCLGKRQGKWGTYVKPTDENAFHAIRRGIRETFGWDLPEDVYRFSGLIGPAVYKSTIRMGEKHLILNVTDIQAERTPFEAKLFFACATGSELSPDAGFNKSTKDARWISLRDLITEQGQNENYLYWSMIARCILMNLTLSTQRFEGGPWDFVPGTEHHIKLESFLDPIGEYALSRAFGPCPPEDA